MNIEPQGQEVTASTSSKRSVALKTTNVQGIYRHPESGRYYARYCVNGKRSFRALKTDVWSVAQARMTQFRRSLESQRIAARSAKDRSWTTEAWNPDFPWKGVPLEVWHLTIDLPPVMTVCRGVYLLGKDSELVYIGMAKNVQGRVIAHLEDPVAKDFNQVRVIPCILGDRTPPEKLVGLAQRRFEAIEHIESTLIRWLPTIYNRRIVASPTNEDPQIEFRRWMDRIRVQELLAA